LANRTLATVVHTLGSDLHRRLGVRVHKVAIDAGFTCPNRDGLRGRGGCTFCNNESFSPNEGLKASVTTQLAQGKAVIRRRTGATRFLAYFQAYSNTYDSLERLKALYDEALADPDVIGLSVGTRPDCLAPGVLELLASYQSQGKEIWLELGLQSAFDQTLERVNRGHTAGEYFEAAFRARALGLRLCTHLILGLPGEDPTHWHETLRQVLAAGTDGLKFHPLHVVKGSLLANQWKRGEYVPIDMETYVNSVADLLESTPPETVIHRLTGTASLDVLLTPLWCQWKWKVLNAIETELRRRGTRQGSALARRA
jgi:radical SAM protein (TIGR01212 family)